MFVSLVISFTWRLRIGQKWGTYAAKSSQRHWPSKVTPYKAFHPPNLEVSRIGAELKAKARDSYKTRLTRKPDQSSEVAVDRSITVIRPVGPSTSPLSGRLTSSLSDRSQRYLFNLPIEAAKHFSLLSLKCNIVIQSTRNFLHCL